GHPEKEITATGAMVGSLYYIAPEVLEGEPASTQSDIWSLGINLFEMLTGQKPFQDDNRMTLIRKITEEEIEFPKEPQIPEALQIIIANMCAKSPYRRYASIDEILRDIDSFKAAHPVRPLRTTMLTPDSEVILKTEKKAGPIFSESPVLIPQPIAPPSTVPVERETRDFRKYAVAGVIALSLLGIVYKMNSTPSEPPTQVIASELETVTTTTILVPETATAPVVADTAPELVEPGNDFEAIEDTNLLFSWSPKVGSTNYRFQISQELEFNQPILDQQIQNTQLSYSGLPSGVYFWRVRAEEADPNTLWSQIRTFRLKPIQPTLAQTVAPIPTSQITYKRPVEKVPVAVAKIKPAQQKLPVKFMPPAKGALSAKSKKAAIQKRERRTASSSLAATENYTLPVPILKLPANGFLMNLVPGAKGSVGFRWEKVPNVETYGLEISADESFTQVLYSLSSETNQLNVSRTFIKGKVLYWRVQSRQAFAKSRWSKPFVIKIRSN
ncbi:MAG: serine/threonine protein kinase, partial [Pseudobdellovibrionaceae bacterium]